MGQHTGANGDQGHNKDGEANGSNSLGDGEGCAKANEFNEDEDPDCGAATNLTQWSGRRSEGLVTGKEDELGGDAVGLEGLDSHDEEETGKDTVGDEVDDDKKGARHGSQCEKTLSQVGKPLLDDMRGLK